MFCLLGEFIEGIMEENEVMEIVSASRRNNQASTTRQFIGERIKHQPSIKQFIGETIKHQPSIKQFIGETIKHQPSIKQFIGETLKHQPSIKQFIGETIKHQPSIKQFIGETIKHQPSIKQFIGETIKHQPSIKQFIGETIKHQPLDSLLEKRSSISHLSQMTKYYDTYSNKVWTQPKYKIAKYYIHTEMNIWSQQFLNNIAVLPFLL